MRPKRENDERKFGVDSTASTRLDRAAQGGMGEKDERGQGAIY